jgi:multidrug efflux system outer membrane protein
LLSLPIFDGGQRAAQEEGARARLEAAWPPSAARCSRPFGMWRIRLSALRLLSGQAHVLGQAVRLRSAPPSLGRALPQRSGEPAGAADARRNELRNRRQALQVRTAQYTATVALIRALGGGWDSGESPAARG